MRISVEKVSFSYGLHPILQDISFQGEYGEFISVLGPNGVGKSTLFRCILGILTPDTGNIRIDDIQVSDMPAEKLARKIAYIPQSHSPVFNFSVLDMVLMGTTAQLNSFESPQRKHIRQAEACLERLGIAHLRDRGYANISGGERQLVLIARAMAQQAKILIMDEPSANLDFGNRIRVMRTVRDLTKDGYTILQSTHDPDQAYLYSDKILALHGGTILAWGTPWEAITESVISQLYGVPVEVCSMRNDEIRVCVSADEIRTERKKQL